MESKPLKELHEEYLAQYDEKLADVGMGTKCIHAGAAPDMIFGCVNVGIHLSSTYAQNSPGEPFGPYDYSRCGNPTRSSLERAIGLLENGKYSLIWSSGMAAITGTIFLLSTGDECICIEDLYGGTQRFFRKISTVKHGVQYLFLDFDNIELFGKSLSPKTKMIWIESPTNPTLKITDIREIIRITKEYNPEIIVVVDNTFMSPINCKPLDLGADIVLESASKYLNGHSDVIMGTTCTNNKDIYDSLYFVSKSTGGVPSPFDCYLVLRGLKTLSIRIERHNSNALGIAKFLSTHKNVDRVLYPGLESSPYHELAKKQQDGFGGVVSFVLNGGLEESKKFLKSLKVFTLAESLGAVESFAEHPACMTHMSVPADVRKQLGIDDGFIRLSVGLEDLKDLIKDLDRALNSIS